MRVLPDWIESFQTYVEGQPSPESFKLWGGIFVIAAACEQRIWVETLGEKQFPNLYTILIAPPGVGKGVVLKRVRRILLETEDLYVSPTSLTKAAFVDTLADSVRSLILPHQTPSSVEFNSLISVSTEMGVLLPTYDSDFMNVLQEIYDHVPYEEKRRGVRKGEVLEIQNPQFNFIAGCTPSFLNGMLPEGAWDQGFLARSLIIYGESNRKPNLFTALSENSELFQNLVSDLKEILKLYGEVKFTQEAADLLQQWYEADGPPRPAHPKLTHYLTRRHMHLLKLMIIACISERDNEMVINESHFTRALSWLLDAEALMPDIFKSMSNGGDSEVIKDAWHFLYGEYTRKGIPVPRTKMIRYLSQHTSSYNVENLLSIMEEGGLLRKTDVNKVGPCFIPVVPNDD